MSLQVPLFQFVSLWCCIWIQNALFAHYVKKHLHNIAVLPFHALWRCWIFFLLFVCRCYEQKELGWHHPSTNLLLVFEEARSNMYNWNTLLSKQTSYIFVYFYDNTTLHNMLLLKLNLPVSSFWSKIPLSVNGISLDLSATFLF